MSIGSPAAIGDYHPGIAWPSLTAISASPPPASASLASFLHHVERRGAVLAELCCGDPVRGDAAVAAAMRALCSAVAAAGAGRGSGADPDLHGRFWTLLLAAPPLRRPRLDGHWPAELAVFGALRPGTRAALLLRMVAGLDDAQAGRALRVAPGNIRGAIDSAGAQPAGTSRAAFWDGVARAIEHHVQQLPAERLVRMAAAREHALLGIDMPRRDARAGARWRRPAMLVAVCAGALAFAATFLPDRAGADSRIAVTALPAADPPASTYDDQTALLTHRDFEQLADTRDAALVRELDFYAWYAAQLAASDAATPVLMPDAARPAPAPSAGNPHASR